MKMIENGVAISPQIDPGTIGDLAAAGVTLIINNRPDGEEAGQPTSAEIEAIAGEHGIAYRHIPTTPDTLSLVHIDQFVTALKEADGTVLAYCRSGLRSTLLWGLSQVRGHGHDPEDVQKRAADAGFDVSPAMSTMVQLSKM